MIKKSCFISLILFISMLASAQHDWVKQYRLDWNTPANNVVDNMPFGAGDMGCNVWVDDGDLLLYIQRSGSFNEIGEYCKLGRIRLKLTPNPFINYTFYAQKLVLEDGYVRIDVRGKNGNRVGLNLWVDQFTHSVHITIDSKEKIAYTVAYENWRFDDKYYTPSEADREDFRKSIHNTPTVLFGSFSFIAAPFEVIKKKDTFGFDNNTVLFYHRNSGNPLSPKVAIEQQGLSNYKNELVNYNKFRTFGGKLMASNAVAAGSSSGRYYYTDFKSFLLKSKAPKYRHHIAVATHIAQEEDLDKWKHDLNEICTEVESSKGNFEKNKKWWNDFWGKSRIVVDPDKKADTPKYWQMGRNYNLVRFLLAGNFTGEFPIKFNGLNVSFDVPNGFDPDWRAWGGDFFTAQNQRLMYWPLLKTGDFDAFKPQFDLYKKALNGAQIRCKEYFGHDGAVFGENTDATGLQLPFLYGWNKKNNKYRRIDLEFGDPLIREVDKENRITKVERGIAANQAMAYHYNSQLEFSYMMLEYYNYSGKSIEAYYPFIKQSLIFFDEHYQKRKLLRDGKPLDKNGKLVIYPSQALENYRIAKNPTDQIAGLQACITSLLKADFVPENDKKYYRSFLSRIPDLPFGKIEGHPVMLPAKEWEAGGNKEMPQFYPLFPYNIFSPDDPEMQAFKNTWKYDKDIRKDDRAVWSWFQNGIFLVRMGRLDECINYQFKKLGDNEEGRRFPAFWGPGLELIIPDGDRAATGMIALQEMLLQNIGDKIYVLPCWDKNIDVEFKLHAPKQTTVEISLKNGKIKKLEVIPSSRLKDVILPENLKL